MSQFRLLTISVLMVIFVLVAATAGAQEPVTVNLEAQNDSGITGTATLTDMGGNQTQVEISVQGSPADASHPVHIHPGTCETLDPAPAHPLNPVENGSSTTTVDASLASLTAGEFAINGHESAENVENYIFCGNIPAGAGGGEAAGDAGEGEAAGDAGEGEATAQEDAPEALPETGADNSGVSLLWLLLIGAGVLFVLGGVARPRTR